MADVHSKAIRSKNMAAIKAGGNKSTEVAFARLMRQNGITGWRRNNKQLPGKPDFIFPRLMVAIFLDGCFWHGCTKCYIPPKTNAEFWANKMLQNQLRDRRVDIELCNRGWTVLHVWEHELRDTNNKKSIKRLKKIFSLKSTHFLNEVHFFRLVNLYFVSRIMLFATK